MAIAIANRINLTIFVLISTSGAWNLRSKRANEDEDNQFSLTPNTGEQSCVTRNGLAGICVFEGQCNEDHTILPGGIIDDSDLRSGNCPGKWDWCCTLEKDNNTSVDKPVVNTRPKAGECTVTSSGKCPWCVALYRDAGNPRTKSPSGLYCAGVLVGSRLVLTSSGCVIAAVGQRIWVQIPDMSKIYNVTDTHKHSEYNSGTREHDVALLVLSEAISWPGGQEIGGACLGLKSDLIDQCYSVGFDKQDRMIFTDLNVTKGSCNDRGAVNDVACGHHINGSSNANTCQVIFGAPVLCGSGKGVIVKGIARDKCLKSEVSLGDIKFSDTWLTTKLSELGLTKRNYTAE